MRKIIIEEGQPVKAVGTWKAGELRQIAQLILQMADNNIVDIEQIEDGEK